MGDRIKHLANTILKYEDVIIYGAGKIAGPVLAWLDENEDFSSMRKHVAVTNPEVNEYFRGYRVERINDLVELREHALIIVAVFSGYFADIDNTLKDLGFKNVIHIEEWFVDEAYYEELKDEPIQNKKVLVENFHGNGYGDSPKYIIEELMRQRDDLDIVWIIRPGLEPQVPEGIRTVDIYSHQFFYEVFTSKVWISNKRKADAVKKRTGQYYIQTWHGFPLKKIEKDNKETSLSTYNLNEVKRDSKMTDLLISNASFLTKIYQESFWYDGEIMECGMPRNDVLFSTDNEVSDKVRNTYHIAKDKKILLYAPTFRNNYRDNPYDADIEAVLELLKDKTGDSWVVLMRMHPNIANKAGLFVYSDRVINATGYSDVMELLCAADILITDYSSIMFDFMIKRKPIFLYTKDRDRYAKDDRGFYQEVLPLPFPTSITNQELLANISCFEWAPYLEGIDQFNQKVGFCDKGTSSKTVVQRINEVLG